MIDDLATRIQCEIDKSEYLGKDDLAERIAEVAREVLGAEVKRRDARLITRIREALG